MHFRQRLVRRVSDDCGILLQTAAEKDSCMLLAVSPRFDPNRASIITHEIIRLQPSQLTVVLLLLRPFDVKPQNAAESEGSKSCVVFNSANAS